MSGIHHVTAIAGNALQNFAFYTRDLGLRFVKKTVNFDDPGTYHFYYGDEAGHPGTILTFFQWEGAAAGRGGRAESDTSEDSEESGQTCAVFREIKRTRRQRSEALTLPAATVILADLLQLRQQRRAPSREARVGVANPEAEKGAA